MVDHPTWRRPESVRVGIYSSHRPGTARCDPELPLLQPGGRDATTSAPRPSEWNLSDVDMLETKGDNRDRVADTIVRLRQWKFISSSTVPIQTRVSVALKTRRPKASEIFSAIMIVGRLVLAHGIVGMSEASQI
jgi:hypothetical protein